MGPALLLLLSLGLQGRGSAGRAKVLSVPLGASLQVQCRYRPQDIRAQKVWCRMTLGVCQPLVTSGVDRSNPGGGRTSLTDLGGGLMQVDMATLQKGDEGEYSCAVEGAEGLQLVHTFSVQVLTPGEPPEGGELGVLGGVPLIWSTVLLLCLLLVAVVLLVVLAKKRGNSCCACGQRLGSGGANPVSPSSSVAPHSGEPRLASDVPYAKLDSPPSFDDTTYTNLALDPPAGKPPPPPAQPSLPPKVIMSSTPVTYATVIFPGGDRGGGASCEPAQDPPSSQS
ncbi:trem-like transcript 1 protein [Ctenodactylus gundi]